MRTSPTLCRLSVLATLALIGCQAAAPRPRLSAVPRASGTAPLTREQEEEARHLYLTLKRAQASGDRAGAQAMATTLLDRFAGSEAAACIHEARALKAGEAGATAEALAELEQILLLRPRFARIDEVRHNYALLLVRANRPADALEFYAGLAEAPAGSPAEAARKRLTQALAASLAEADALGSAIDLLLRSSHLAGTTAAEGAAARQAALDLLPRLTDEAARTLFAAHEREARWQPIVGPLALRLAKSPALGSDEAEQERLLGLVIALEPDGPLGLEARQMLSEAARRHQVEPKTVGLLLPLSGRFSQFGERAKAAVELALAGRTDLTLVVKDTGGDPNLAVQAIESLVYESHAIAAVGPLFSAEAVAAASRSEALGLPLLTLSHQEGLTSTGPTIFRTALTVPAQARALAAVAFDQLGMRRFALLAPQNRYGTDFLQAFWDEVERRQGSIRGAEFYPANATTFRQPIRKLVGRWYLHARPEFHEPFQALKDGNVTGVRLRAEVDRLDKKTRPVIDFDAIVIPDSGRQLGLIAPALAFEDIAVSRDEKTLDKMRRTLNQNDIKPIVLLGSSPWNSQATLDACEQYCERAVFVDAFFAGATRGPTKAFVDAFVAKVGSEPALGEAQAFDTAGLLARALSGRSRPETRRGLIASLHSLPPYEGVCGTTSFDGAGESQRTLQALTIFGHRIVPLEQAPLPPLPPSAIEQKAAPRAALDRGRRPVTG